MESSLFLTVQLSDLNLNHSVMQNSKFLHYLSFYDVRLVSLFLLEIKRDLYYCLFVCCSLYYFKCVILYYKTR